jgi:hypothetical protein
MADFGIVFDFVKSEKGKKERQQNRKRKEGGGLFFEMI